MIDERAELERAVQRFHPEPGMIDRVYRRHRRKEQGRRIRAGALAFVLVIGLAASAVTMLRSETVPADLSPAPLPLMHNGPIDVFGFTNGVRELHADGLGAFAVKCEGSCTEIMAASWSPDGTSLAFSASCGGGCGSAGHPYHGVRIAEPGVGSDRLILPGDGIFPLAWSPDGSRIAYVIHGHEEAAAWVWDPTWVLRVMKIDGTQQVDITSGSAGPLPDSVSWSPDGSRIAYGVAGTIFVIGLDGSAPSPIAAGQYAAWSGHDDTIAYLAGCDVRTTTPEGGGDRSLVDLTSAGNERCDRADGLTWAPDGSALAVMVSLGVADPKVPSTRAVFVVSADGNDVRVIRDGGLGAVSGSAWQPVP